MDAALILKQKFDSGEIKDFRNATEYLDKSLLLKELLVESDFETIDLLNRLIEISEIPFASEIPKVKEWIKKLVEWSFCGNGFSYTGKSENILPCYNAMISSILIKTNYPDRTKIKKGIEWILKYQNLRKGEENKWEGTSIWKYGACMKNTPCYIGVVKSVIALSDYKNTSDFSTKIDVDKKLQIGLEYILSHNLFQRKSNGQPITSYITKLTYPFFYKTNIIELLKLMKDNGLDSDSRCFPAKELLKSKKKKDGYWHVNSVYSPKYWIAFDKSKVSGFWISYEIQKVLKTDF